MDAIKNALRMIGAEANAKFLLTEVPQIVLPVLENSKTIKEVNMTSQDSDIKMKDLVPKNDAPMAEMMEITLTSEASKNEALKHTIASENGECKAGDVLDLEKLQVLLKQSKHAADKIADKDVMLLIGGTGAGKVGLRARVSLCSCRFLLLLTLTSHFDFS